MKGFAVILLFSLLPNTLYAACTKNTPAAGMVECKYSRFTTWVSCNQNATVMSWHSLDKDTGSQDTSNRSYKVDPDPALAGCQQSSSKTYAKQKKGYDVGHNMSAINHFDDDKAAALQTNFMTNLLPQVSSFNQRGAWRQSEKMVECYRDEPGYAPLLVYQGPIFGDDPSNDHYTISHDLPQTPDYYWKVVYSEGKNSYDAWIMPNSRYATKKRLPEYRRSLSALAVALQNEEEAYYFPVISELRELIRKEPGQVELKNKSSCRGRDS